MDRFLEGRNLRRRKAGEVGRREGLASAEPGGGVISTHEETAVRLLEWQPDTGGDADGSHRRDRQWGLKEDHMLGLGFWLQMAGGKGPGGKKREAGVARWYYYRHVSEREREREEGNSS